MDATSPKMTAKPFRALVDAAPALNEIAQRLIHFLVFGRVAQHPRPFAPRPIIDLVWSGNSSKRFRLSNRIVPSQVRGPMSAPSI